MARRSPLSGSGHHGVGFSDGSAFIIMLGELLVGYVNPYPLLIRVDVRILESRSSRLISVRPRA